MEWHQFALVITIPAGREAEWDALLERTVAPIGMRCEKRHAALLILEVEAEVEFLAIEKADLWLQTVAERAHPPFRVRTNAQPANEV